MVELLLSSSGKKVLVNPEKTVALIEHPQTESVALYLEGGWKFEVTGDSFYPFQEDFAKATGGYRYQEGESS